MGQQNDMQQLSERASTLINSIAEAIMSTAEAAAERIELASQVARLQQRMSAFGSVLEAIAVQKQALLEQQSHAGSKPLAALYGQQIAMLTTQEVAILAKIGCPAEVTTAALEEADRKLYVRDGKRFQPVNGTAASN